MTSRAVNLLDRYEKIVKKTLNESIPFKADWELTYRCNLRCSHCYQTGPRKEKELTLKEIRAVLDELAQMGFLYLTFTGGEVLMRKDFFAIARYAREKEFAIRIFTNGTLIDEDAAQKIKALNPLSVEISLYGTDPRVHESITRVKGSHAKTLRALSLLKHECVPVIMKCTFMKANLGEFDALTAFAKQMRLAFSYSFTVIPNVGGKEVLHHRLDSGSLAEVFRRHPSLIQQTGEGGVQSYAPLCSAGLNSLYISPYGEVYPCVVLRRDCGTTRDSSLRAIWQSPFFRELRSIEFKDLTICRTCHDAAYCDRCAGLALVESNDLYGISPNDCVLAKARHDARAGKNVQHREDEDILKKTCGI